jgi:glutaredoxin 1
MSGFTVYGRPGCGYCVAAVRLLQSKNLPHQYIDMYAEGISPTELATKIGHPVRTVPQIVHGEKYIGGYTDLVPYLKGLEAA